MALAMMVCTLLPISRNDMARSVVNVQYAYGYQLLYKGKPLAYFTNIDTTLTPAETLPGQLPDTCNRAWVQGCWVNRYRWFPSCHGDILVVRPYADIDHVAGQANAYKGTLLANAGQKLRQYVATGRKRLSELDYYLSTHNAADDGYNQMAAYKARLAEAVGVADSTLALLHGIKDTLWTDIMPRVAYAAVYMGADGKAHRTGCYMQKEGSRGKALMLRTADSRKPHGARALYSRRWLVPTLAAGDSVSVVSLAPACDALPARAVEAKGVIGPQGRHDVPPLLAPLGAPVFTQGGFMAGVNIDGRVVGIHRLLHPEKYEDQ